ncbi:MAG: hypothetical protein WCJ64_22270 [Rhodospirillaceae bacterium]
MVTRTNVTVTATNGTQSRDRVCANGRSASLLVRKLRANSELAMVWLDGGNPPELDDDPLPPAPAE